MQNLFIQSISEVSESSVNQSYSLEFRGSFEWGYGL